MKRRAFAQHLSVAALSLPLAGELAKSKQKNLLKPKRLEKGQTVGLITPGSYATEKAVQQAIENMDKLGLKVKMGKHVGKSYGFVAGTDQERLEDLHAMFSDDAVDVIWCIRGGYGCTRLLPYINYDLVRNNPKVFIGYSDITALHQAFFVAAGLISFHGQNATGEMPEYAQAQIQKVLFREKKRWKIKLAEANKAKASKDSNYATTTLRAGKATGQLVGGNLTLIAAMAGTPYGMDATDKIVFLEDIGEKPYRIDRMLTQLLQSAHLNKAKGIALGIFNDCEAKPDELSLTLMETLKDRLMDLNVPFVHGLSFGHIEHQCVIPVGAYVELDANEQTIHLLESPVL